MAEMQRFQPIFPSSENFAAGAVPFTPSVAKKTEHNAGTVKIHAFVDSEDTAQAKQIVSIIHACKTQDARQSIAVLVGARSHIPPILAALKNTGLKYRGVKLEALKQQPLIQDLFALTKALLQLADRIAWYAILRAPWCGLTLADLHTLAQAAQQHTLWDVLKIRKCSWVVRRW